MALAILTLARANLLALDEPTNHLDVESIEVLEDALEEFDGTVLLVSHDRAFLRELATRVWAFDGDRIYPFDGTFAEWEEWRAARRAAAAREAAARAVKPPAPAKPPPPKTAKADGAAVRATKRRLEALEQSAKELEARVADAEARLADPSLYAGGGAGARKAQAIDAELVTLRAELELVMAEWVLAADQTGDA
jgi:ATP-binding cassette subfamily F protein 3